MSTSKKQAEANKRNAKKSTGPKTPAGKAKVSSNAMKHGILSTKLLLPHENEDDFDALMNEMHKSLKPVGTMEKILVEKIAVNIWRQCRLTNAESAQLSLQTRPDKISEELKLERLSVNEFQTETGNPDGAIDNRPSLEKRILNELENVDINNISISDLPELEISSPSACALLHQYAMYKNLSVEEYCRQDKNGLSAFLKGMKKDCIRAVEKESIPKSLPSKIKEWVIAKNAISRGEMEKQLSRYQTSLDNELYKAMKALREQQKWRLEAIDGEAEVIN